MHATHTSSGYKSRIQSGSDSATLGCSHIKAHMGTPATCIQHRTGANFATLNDNDMATRLRHRLIAGRQRERVEGRRRRRQHVLAGGVKE